jgi:tRNA dimethylallyltransferase
MVSAHIADAAWLAVVCGPTASGKTDLSIALAERLDAEIVVADSRTVYRGMDIGTAKPSVDQRRRVPHHVLDVAEPSERFTVADFQRLARAAIDDIQVRGRIPLIVGGTGLYIRAVVDALVIPAVVPDSALRAALEDEERALGPGRLHARLASLDPVAAGHIHPRNVRRLIRALEVVARTGRPISAQQQRGAIDARAVIVGLTMARPVLYQRIDVRIEQQLAAGLVDETRRMLAAGVPLDAPSMQGLGYKELAGWLSGAYGYDDAIRLLRRNTRHHAKRQLTWFRRDPRIRWLDLTDLSQGDAVRRAHAIMVAERDRAGRA